MTRREEIGELWQCAYWCVRGEDQRKNCKMTTLLLAGLLVTVLVARGTGFAVTVEPVLQENPDVFTETTEESTPASENPAGDKDYDAEEEEEEDSTNESSGDWAAGNEPDTPSDNICNGDQSNCKGPPILIIILSVVLVVLFLLAAVSIAIVLSQRRKKKNIPCEVKELDGLAACDAITVPTPMFDDDIPSVQELEMEDLQKWDSKTDSGETASASGQES